MRTTITYGYGFPCGCSKKSIVDFIKLHRDSFCASELEKKIFQCITSSDGDTDNLDDIFDQASALSIVERTLLVTHLLP